MGGFSLEKLSDLVGTKYITNDHTGVLCKILEMHTEIDLAGCKLSPESERIIRQYYGKITFCNSKDMVLDNILKHNREAVADTKHLTAVPLPIDIITEEEVIKYFKTIDKSKIYSLENCRINKVKCLSLAILLTIRHPDVVFDLREFASDLFKQVRLDWTNSNKKHRLYNEVIGTAIVEREVIDDKVQIPGVGYITEELFVSSYNALPADFGKVNLYGHPEFKAVWDTAIKNLMGTLEDTKTMRDYIEIFD